MKKPVLITGRIDPDCTLLNPKYTHLVL